MAATHAVAEDLRRWRGHRRVSQLELALLADTTQRHVSFIERGRSRPGRELLLRLFEALEIPLRERNKLLLAAGYAPQYPESEFAGELLRPIRETLLRVLDGHLPAPAVVVAPGGDLVAANEAFDLLAEGANSKLLEPPLNVLRLALHPEGMAPRIANLDAWGRHILHGLRSRLYPNARHAQRALLRELEGYVPSEENDRDYVGFAVPLLLECSGEQLQLVTTISTFATATDVTLNELALEAFLPGDRRTAEVLRERMSQRSERRNPHA